MKPPTTYSREQPKRAPTLHTPVVPQVPQRIRRRLNAAYAARGGPEHMTLDDWRAVEEELQERLENEN